MRGPHLGFLAGAATAAGVATFVYGMLHVAEDLRLREQTLLLSDWPERLDGYRIALLSDLHLRGPYSARIVRRALALAAAQPADALVIAGDFVEYWSEAIETDLLHDLEALRPAAGRIVACAGNHDYFLGTPDRLRPALADLGGRLLVNETAEIAGVTFVGLDSVNGGRPDPGLLARTTGDAQIVLWHEPDVVGRLPQGASLMLSGHSHGGQFVFPGGIMPAHTRNGRVYRGGYYPDAPTPLFVSTGVGTTGFPSRLNCPPEVVVLTLRSR